MSIASRAAAYQALGVSTSEWLFNIGADPELNRLWALGESADGWAELSHGEREQVYRLWLSALRLGETVHLAQLDASQVLFQLI